MSWGITITANNGETYAPDLYAPRGQAMPREIPAANGTPTLQFGVLPLDGAESWFDRKFENCDISVTKDGTTQPYSTLRGPRSDSAEGIIVLEADGGEQLQRRVDESFELTEVHSAAETVVTNNTDYGIDIPTPDTDTFTREIQSRSATGSATLVPDNTTGDPNTYAIGKVGESKVGEVKCGGFEFTVSNVTDISAVADTSPVRFTDTGQVTLYQTLHFYEAGPTTLANIGDAIEFEFTNDYTIPVEAVAIGVVGTSNNTINPAIDVSVDGTVIKQIKPAEFFPFLSATDWVLKVGSDENLRPGTHTVRLEVVQTEYEGGSTTFGELEVEGAAVYDDRFNYDFDTDLVNGPELYPNAYDADAFAKLRTVVAPYAVVGAEIDTEWVDDNKGRVALRNGVNFASAEGSDIDSLFADRGDRIDLSFGFKAYGSDNTKTPESGFKCETLNAYTLLADLETMPLVSNERYQDTVSEVLTELGDTLRGDFVWTFDTDGAGNRIVRFVRTGARTSTENAIESFGIRKYTEGLLQEVEVLGGPVAVSGEGVRVAYDTPIQLNRPRIFEQSETVELDGNTFDRGVHYTMDYEAGEITFDSAPNDANPIPQNALVRLSYEFQPRATASTTTNPTRTRVVDGLPLRSDAACRLAAEQILDATSTPQYNASAEVRADTTFSVVTELVANRLPVSNLEVTDITATPAGSRARLEARQSDGEVIAQVRDRINNVAKHIR